MQLDRVNRHHGENTKSDDLAAAEKLFSELELDRGNRHHDENTKGNDLAACEKLFNERLEAEVGQLRR